MKLGPKAAVEKMKEERMGERERADERKEERE